MTKRLTTSVLATAALLAGLLAGGAPAAVSAPYPGSVGTDANTSVPDTVQDGSRAHITVRVSADGSARALAGAKPKGTVKVTVRRNAGGYSFSDSAGYHGGKVVFTTGKLTKNGKYSVSVRFVPKEGSVYKGSHDTDSFRVVG